MSRIACTIAALAVALGGCGLFGGDDSPRSVVPTAEVLRFEPRGEVPATRVIRVQFSEPMVGVEAVGQPRAPDEVLVVEPKLGGRGRWTAPDTFEVEPGRPLAPNTRYTARVREHVVGPGRRLVGRRRFSFRTPLFRVLSVHGARVGAGLQAVVELSHEVAPEDAAGAITFRDGEGRVLAARLLGPRVQRLLRFSVPSEGLEQQGEIVARVEPTLAPACGGAALDKPVVVRLDFAPPGAPEVIAAEAVPTEAGPGIRVRLDADVDAQAAARYVSTTPAADFELVAAHRGFVLQGKLRPETHYFVLLKEGLPTASGPLDSDTELEVTLPPRAPSVRFAEPGPFLVADDAVSLSLVNVRRLLVRVLHVPDRNVAFVDPDGDGPPEGLSRVVAEQTLSAAAPADRRVPFTIPLAGLLRGGAGLYRLEVEDADHPWVRAGGWLVQHGLRLSAKLGPNSVRARVQRPADDAPVTGAQVQGYSRSGRRLFSLRSDGRGVAEQVGRLDPDDPVAWLVARRGRAAAYLPMARARVPLPKGPGLAHADAFVWTARDLLLPGETLHAFALVEGGAPAGLRFELLGPDGPVGAPVAAEVQGGLAHGQLPLGPEVSAGLYTVRALGAGADPFGETTVTVVAVDPPALRVKVEPEGRPAPGAPVPFSVRVTSRYGGRTAGFKVTGRCLYRPIPVRAQGLTGFRFGRGAPTERPRALDAPNAEVGEDGRATVVCPPPALDSLAGHRVQVELSVRAHEPGGRPVGGAAAIVADPARHYFGLRNRAGVLEVAAVAPEGEPAADVPLVARVSAAPLRAGMEGSGVARFELRTGATGAKIPFEAPRAGRYRAEIESEAGRTAAAMDFWVLTGTAAETLPYVQVGLPAEAPPIGATLPVQLQLPFPGRVRLSVERDRVLFDAQHDVLERSARVDLPMLASFAPNARVVVALEGAGGRRAYGAAALVVGTKARRLELQVELPEGSSGRRFPVAFRVRGAKGRAYAQLVVVSAERWRDARRRAEAPINYLSALRPIEVTTHDRLGLLFPDEAAARGWGGASSAFVAPPARAPSPSEPFVSSLVKVTEAGYGWAAVRPPASGGPALLSVLVFDGEAAAHVVIPLDRGAAAALRLGAPAALVPGDRVQVPLTIENPGATAWTATASASVSAPLALGGPARLRVSVPAGASRAVDFTVEAKRAGQGTFSARVRSAAGSQEASSPIRVRGLVTPQIEGSATEATDRAPGRLVPPSGLDLAASRARLVVGPGRVHELLVAFEALWSGAPRSPALSAARGLALLEAPELAKREGRAELARAQLTKDLKAVTRALDSEGRLRAWPEGPQMAFSSFAQAGLLLAEARRSGRAVDPGAWARVVRRLGRVVADAGRTPEDRALAAFVLTRGRERKWAAPDVFADPAASVMTRALGAAALLGTGRGKAGRALLGGDFAPGADVRANAWTLLALATVVPGLGAIDPLWSAVRAQVVGAAQTPEIDMLAVAAARRLDRARPAGRPFWGSVVVGGEVLKRFNSNRVTVLDEVAADWRGGIDLTVTGAGRAHASLVVRGPSKTAPRAAERGLALTRRHIYSAGDAESGRTELGALWATEIQVRATGPEARGPVVVNVPVAAGFAVEQVWPKEVPGLDGVAVGRIEDTPEGLRWRVAVGAAPVRLFFTVRAVRPGRFLEPPVEAWRMDAVTASGRTDPTTWTVTSP